MNKDNRKICFVTCVNDTDEYEECLFYINHLKIPKGICVEIMEIREAVSMAAGYNEARLASNAKYKVYLHQDSRIVNRDFIDNCLQIFQNHTEVGLIGMVGSPVLPSDGVMWHGPRVGASTGRKQSQISYCESRDGVERVETVDGFCMVTQYDLPWREDLFDGWDFYDISQCKEFELAGYDVVVPNITVQNTQDVWCVHEEKPALSLGKYNRYRLRFLEYYQKKVGE